MATSARTASLQAQRSGYNPYGSTGKIRLLSPSNNAVASIAKKTATNELNVMVSRYNNGEISNEDMKNFLLKMSTTPGLSESDKLDVQTQIKDFDDKILGEQLTASYKAAPEGTLQQYQAAQSIANYHNQRASKMLPGTPAHSQALQNAADWGQRVVDVKTAINKTATQNLRYQEELKVNSIPDGTSEQAQQKAQMYQALYDKAVADGDQVGANKYAAYYQDQMTKAQTLSEKETVTGEKTRLRDALNSYVNAYHDGQINEQQYLQLLADISPDVDATGDYGLINSLNRTTDTIQKNLDKGGLKRGVTAGGLPTVLGKNKGGSGSGVVTDWDQEDYQYTDTLRVYQEAFRKGEIDGEQYRDGVGKATMTHYNEVTKMISTLEETASVNPNTKVMFEGKKTKVSDALDKLYKDQEDLQGAAQAVDQGTFGIVEVPPGEFNESGKVGSGKAFATYKPVDVNNMPSDQYAKDDEGIFHMIEKETRPLTLEEQAQVYNGTLAGADGKLYKVTTDSSGNQSLVTGGQKYRTYKPGTSEYFEYPTGMQENPSYGIVETRMKKQDAELAKYAGMTITDDKSRAKAVKIAKEKVRGKPAQEQAKEQASNQNLVNKVLSTGTKAVGSLASAVTPDANATTPVASKVASAEVIAPKPIQLPVNASVEGANIPSGIANLNPVSTVMPQVKQPTLKLTTPSAITKMAQSSGMKPVSISTPYANAPKVNKAQISQFDKKAEELRKKANNPLGTAVTNIKKLFKF